MSYNIIWNILIFLFVKLNCSFALSNSFVFSFELVYHSCSASKKLFCIVAVTIKSAELNNSSKFSGFENVNFMNDTVKVYYDNLIDETKEIENLYKEKSDSYKKIINHILDYLFYSYSN